MGIKAKYLRTLDGFLGETRLYALSEPVRYRCWWDDDEPDKRPTTLFVIVSAAVTMDHGPETYIFPADEGGEIANWDAMDGSFIGGLDHARAIREAGWELED